MTTKERKPKDPKLGMNKLGIRKKKEGEIDGCRQVINKQTSSYHYKNKKLEEEKFNCGGNNL
jgi:hypothetical protein